jgi:hypothetical protein
MTKMAYACGSDSLYLASRGLLRAEFFSDNVLKYQCFVNRNYLGIVSHDSPSYPFRTDFVQFFRVIVGGS